MCGLLWLTAESVILWIAARLEKPFMQGTANRQRELAQSLIAQSRESRCSVSDGTVRLWTPVNEGDIHLSLWYQWLRVPLY